MLPHSCKSLDVSHRYPLRGSECGVVWRGVLESEEEGGRKEGRKAIHHNTDKN